MYIVHHVNRMQNILFMFYSVFAEEQKNVTNNCCFVKINGTSHIFMKWKKKDFNWPQSRFISKTVDTHD